ncbi:MAG: hypothetical protein JF606_22050 [Burkholderiales bacterium]|jgi:hypothetical protein|nr:hypothetical protein [Burkholderiales bacterium]
MTRINRCLAAFALLFCVSALPALAASSAASSASESITTSVGSISDSIQKSSTSSTNTTAAIEGDYNVVEVAALPEQPGTMRMKLQAVADQGSDGEFFLYLPQKAVEQGELALGQVVTARQRPYGVEFSNAQTRKAFFLALTDDWYRELQTNAVVL